MEAKAESRQTNTGAVTSVERLANKKRVSPKWETTRDPGTFSCQRSSRKRQLKWFGHLYRMNEDKNPRKFLEAQLGRRPRGRPRLTWKDHISRLGQRKGKGLNAMKTLARNRNAWLAWIEAPPLIQFTVYYSPSNTWSMYKIITDFLLLFSKAPFLVTSRISEANNDVLFTSAN